MASSDNDAKIVNNCSRGIRARYTFEVPLKVANARTNMTAPNHLLADAIQNQSIVKGVFAAPCAGKIVRCYCNASAFGAMAAGGTATVTFAKAVIGGSDVNLNTAITVGANTQPTAETVRDGTLSATSGALDLLDGQLVYLTLAVSNHSTTTRTTGLVACVEFVPTD